MKEGARIALIIGAVVAVMAVLAFLMVWLLLRGFAKAADKAEECDDKGNDWYFNPLTGECKKMCDAGKTWNEKEEKCE